MAWIQSDFQSSGSSEYVPPEWSSGTDAEIVEALNKHYRGEIDLHDYWSIGDERTIHLSAMSATGVGESHAERDMTFILTESGGMWLPDNNTNCAFQVDMIAFPYGEGGYIHSSNKVYYPNCNRRTWCDEVYRLAIPESIRSIFKRFYYYSNQGSSSTNTQLANYFALRSETEFAGTTNTAYLAEGTQVEYFKTKANRTKHCNGAMMWTRSIRYQSGYYYAAYISYASGDYYGRTTENDTNNLAVFGCI